MSEDSCLEVPPLRSGTCAFCDYLSGRRPFTILHKSATVATLVTREQRGLPHVLVLPLHHCETLLDLPDDLAGDLMLEIKRAAKAIDQAFCRPGISVWQNNGIDANQAIPHLHFHVAGTIEGGGTEWGDVPELSVDETDILADRLRPYLRSR